MLERKINVTQNHYKDITGISFLERHAHWDNPFSKDNLPGVILGYWFVSTTNFQDYGYQRNYIGRVFVIGISCGMLIATVLNDTNISHEGKF